MKTIRAGTLDELFEKVKKRFPLDDYEIILELEHKDYYERAKAKQDAEDSWFWSGGSFKIKSKNDKLVWGSLSIRRDSVWQRNGLKKHQLKVTD